MSGRLLRSECGNEPLKAGKSIRRVLLYFMPKDDRGLHKRRHGSKDLMERDDLINILQVELADSLNGQKIYTHEDGF